MSAIRQAEPLISAAEASELGLDRDALLRIYRNMAATRAIEERGNLLFKAGRLPGSYYTGRGNEAASVGVASAMGPDDIASPLHRNMGVHVTRGVNPAAIFCQYMGRSGGATGGRDSNLRTNDFSSGKGLLAGVSHLRLVPMTGAEVTAAKKELELPPAERRLFGMLDYTDEVFWWGTVQTEDDIRAIVYRHRQAGFGRIYWRAFGSHLDNSLAVPEAAPRWTLSGTYPSM